MVAKARARLEASKTPINGIGVETGLEKKSTKSTNRSCLVLDMLVPLGEVSISNFGKDSKDSLVRKHIQKGQCQGSEACKPLRIREVTERQ